MFRGWLITFSTLVLAGCGGSDSSSPPPPSPPAAPSSLSYPAAPAFTLGVAIATLTPTVTGSPTAYSVSPALPAGLAINVTSGVISGTPTAVGATASYQVTASNAGGSTAASVSITVNDVAPGISYPASSYTMTTGTPVNLVPTRTGGAVVTWSIDKTLPTGLAFNTSNGVISGTPTAGSIETNYVVRAQNSGGADAFSIRIKVAAAQSTALLELGHINPISRIVYEGNRILSGSGGRFVLSDAQSSAQVGAWLSGCQNRACESAGSFAGNTVAIRNDNDWQLYSSTDGALVSQFTVGLPGQMNFALASDGNYIASVTTTNELRIHSRAGALLVSRTGNYRDAIFFAAPNELRVANGPAGAQVIEYISIPTGTVTTSNAFGGTFVRWFLDGERFIAVAGNTARIYSHAGAQLDIGALPTVEGIAGNGNWYWTLTSGAGIVQLYAVGSGGTPAASYSAGTGGYAIGSASALALVPYGTPAISIVDLSGATPVRADYVSPFAYIRAFAATSASKWAFGATDGVLAGELGSGPPRIYTLGRARSIAGSSSRVAVATAAGKILIYNANSKALETTIDWSSSQLSMSADGSRLGAAATAAEAQYVPDRTLRVYSLPAGTVLREWPSNFLDGQPWSYDFSLSASGEVVGQTLARFSGGWTVTQRSMRLDGTVLWSQDRTAGGGLDDAAMVVRLDSTGARLAAPDRARSAATGTNIYQGSTLGGAATGWPVGWIDDTRLLVNRYSAPDDDYAGVQIVDATGAPLASPALIELRSLQTLGTNNVYSAYHNQIFDILTGNTVWASTAASFADGTATGVGAVAGNYIYFGTARAATVQVEPR